VPKPRNAAPSSRELPPPLGLHMAPREKLADTVARQLLDRMSSLPRGSRLPTVEQLAGQMGVSRMTVREALRGLATIGMVDIRHGSGVYVAAPVDSPLAAGSESLSGEVIRELLEARQIIEVGVAGLAAERLTSADEEALLWILIEHHQQLSAGKHPVIPGSEFHVRLLAAAKNKVLEGHLSAFFRLMINRGPAFYDTVEGYAAEEYAQHRAVLEAVRTRNADVARLRMSQHVVWMSDQYLGSLPG
jgi:GntR family transcriptional regulator, transcriptional repressor for pyruvate dehydrogenase complex